LHFGNEVGLFLPSSFETRRSVAEPNGLSKMGVKPEWNVVIVDDFMTTGSSVLKAINAVREHLAGHRFSLIVEKVVAWIW